MDIDNEETDEVFLETEIEDSQLRMIFTCCHSSISTESQIALTLKTLCGFSVKEVANALVTNESNINKRLFRAKEHIRNSDRPFDIPQGIQLEDQLNTVGITLYLLFNEGYNSTTSETTIRKDLCLEAVRLTKLLVDRFPEQHRISALLSLMCFHVARFDSRIDDHGGLILFEEQDRSLWSQEMTDYGLKYFRQSLRSQTLSSYHIEAKIAAEHCIAKDFKSTNWKAIKVCYRQLAIRKSNPLIQLNLAIIESQISGYQNALEMLLKLEMSGQFKNNHLLPASKGFFYQKLDRFDEAIDCFLDALNANPSKKEKEIIHKNIEATKKRMSN